ncbi:MAG: hypothetical protein IJS78_05930 [Clostridia bacterium]|nr:hypothetical protein [Clostridia bacterium]
MAITFFLDPKADVGAVKEACAAAKEGGYEYICLPQWFVSFAKAELEGSAVGVATILGLPGGTTSPYAKFAEAKQAILAGAALIIFPVNMALLEAGDFAAAKADLDTALVACKIESGKKSGVKTAALIDGEKLGTDALRRAAENCVASGVGSVMIAHNEAAAEAISRELPAVVAF